MTKETGHPTIDGHAKLLATSDDVRTREIAVHVLGSFIRDGEVAREILEKLRQQETDPSVLKIFEKVLGPQKD